MGCVCKGFCDDFKSKKIANGSKYQLGQKRCSLCSVFMTVQGFRCPCCSTRLRTKSRNKRYV